jgi:polygalacturonase
MLHGHGMSIGSETGGGVKNVIVQRCSFQDTENGLRIKSPRGRGGTVENVFYSDIIMKNVDPAITITCYYPKIPAEDAPQAMTNTTPIFRNIRIKNLSAICPRDAGIIIGLPESPISGVLLENVRITAARSGLVIRNAEAVQLKNVQVTPGVGSPIIVRDAQVKGAKSGPPQE